MKQRACYYSKHQNTAKFKKKKTRNKASPKSQKFTRHNKTIHEPGRGEHGSLRCPPSQVGWGRSFMGARPRDGGSGRAEQPTLPAVPCPRSRPTHARRAAQAPQPPPRPPLAATCAPGGAAEAARQRPPPLFPAGPARTPPASRRRAAALTWQPRPRRSRYARPGPPAPRSRGRKHKGGRAVPAPGAGGGGSASLTRLSRRRLRRGAPGALPPPLLQVPLPPRGGREGARGAARLAAGPGGSGRPSLPRCLTHRTALTARSARPGSAQTLLLRPSPLPTWRPPPPSLPAPADPAPAPGAAPRLPGGAAAPAPCPPRGCRDPPAPASSTSCAAAVPAPSEGPRPPGACAGPARPSWTPRARGRLLTPGMAWVVRGRRRWRKMPGSGRAEESREGVPALP